MKQKIRTDFIHTEFDENEIVEMDFKWGEEDFTRMKTQCVSCGAFLKMSKKRFIMLGNYCLDCSSKSGVNINHKVITIKPYDS